MAISLARLHNTKIPNDLVAGFKQHENANDPRRNHQGVYLQKTPPFRARSAEIKGGVFCTLDFPSKSRLRKRRILVFLARRRREKISLFGSVLSVFPLEITF